MPPGSALADKGTVEAFAAEVDCGAVNWGPLGGSAVSPIDGALVFAESTET